MTPAELDEALARRDARLAAESSDNQNGIIWFLWYALMVWLGVTYHPAAFILLFIVLIVQAICHDRKENTTRADWPVFFKFIFRLAIGIVAFAVSGVILAFTMQYFIGFQS